MKRLGLNPIEKGVYIFVFVILAVGFTLWFVNSEIYMDSYVVEDGFVEYTTAVMLFACSVLLTRRLLNKKIRKNKWWVMTTLFLILLFFFGAGEEISWGQRLFGLESGEFFKEYNAQGETNLHNLVVGEMKINKVIFGQLLTVVLAVYLFGFPFLYRRWEKFSRLIDKFGVPVPKYHHSVAFLVIAIAVALIPASKKWELYEFAFGFIFFILLLFPYNLHIYQPKETENQ